jgi:isopentenyl-diphosphate delta-isomerase
MDVSTSPRDADEVILVDEKDKELGVAPKLHVHQTGALHRAVSVFLFDASRSLLLQRRAATKYHSAGLWSNTCCGHPRPGESTLDAARRRLKDELGIVCDIFPASHFAYSADLGGGLIENEIDHLFFGYFSGSVTPAPNEVAEVRWMPVEAVMADIARAPHEYTPWLRLALRQLEHRGVP